MLKNLILKNRSYRSFDMNRKITEKELGEMVDGARQTGSTANLQALKYRLCFNKYECDIVLSVTKWAGYLKDEVIPPENHAPTAYIIICCDNSISENTTLFYKDTGIAAQTILLVATEMGLGGCMIGSFDEKELKKQLDLPNNVAVTLVVALGKPDEQVEIVESTGDIKYYRKNGTNYVPKRSLDEIILN